VAAAQTLPEQQEHPELAPLVAPDRHRLSVDRVSPMRVAVAADLSAVVRGPVVLAAAVPGPLTTRLHRQQRQTRAAAAAVVGSRLLAATAATAALEL
jgi:hypothetical protein